MICKYKNYMGTFRYGILPFCIVLGGLGLFQRNALHQPVRGESAVHPLVNLRGQNPEGKPQPPQQLPPPWGLGG